MRHNNKIFITLMLALITLGSCNKYLDVNTDPNRVTDANITAELIFPQAANAVGARAANGGSYLNYEHWVGYSAQNGAFAPQQNEISYNIDESYANTLWEDQWEVLFDLYQTKVKAQAEGNTALAGAAMILSAKLWQETVDMFGNIPFSQAFQVTKYPLPAYDDAKTIYNSLQTMLDSAIIYMGGTPPKSFATADIVNHGNQNLWILFANTLKLRLMIRQSEVSGYDPSADAAKITANGGVLMAGQDISVNPGYSNDVNKQNPFYNEFGWSPTGVVSTSSDNANNYIVTLLSNDADPRLARFFYPVGFTGSTYAGAIYGAPTASIPSSTNLSYFGPGLVGPITSSNVGDGTGAKQNQWIMPSYESLFFLAEATARGWFPGNADSIYYSAVEANFTFVGATFDTTAFNSNADANYATVAGASAETQAKFIAFQKYLANTMIDPLESYSDIRRLNMLTDMSYISVYAGRVSNTLPVRFLYPTNEYTTNSANVLKQGTINQFTSKIFWQP